RNEENAQSTNNHAKSSVEDAKILFQEMTGSKTLNLDDEGVAVIVDETLLAELRQKSNLKKYSLSKATSSLLKLVSQADTSISVLRNVIKSYELPSDESFDTVLHADDRNRNTADRKNKMGWCWILSSFRQKDRNGTDRVFRWYLMEQNKKKGHQ
ncbi:hypothetical protein BD560DRAFT_322148, partial [Blakeslea trispora]